MTFLASNLLNKLEKIVNEKHFKFSNFIFNCCAFMGANLRSGKMEL
uniref:Uncharacterized protein n=1 Tax=uncultured Sphingobacteriales bacterium HF0010_19H17 TaxID=710990 RepID=E0XRC1_9SPHI|nr:hypothetical protein [uncultured Sphingobacteriales bacterium HF0010_19H17]